LTVARSISTRIRRTTARLDNDSVLRLLSSEKRLLIFETVVPITILKISAVAIEVIVINRFSRKTSRFNCFMFIEVECNTANSLLRPSNPIEILLYTPINVSTTPRAPSILRIEVMEAALSSIVIAISS
jgi:hypothetical protein